MRLHPVRTFIAHREQQGGGLAGLVLHLLGLQELEDPLPRGGGGLEGLDRLGDLGQGLGEVPDVQHEGHDDPEADGVVEGHGAPHHADGHIAEVADEAHNGASSSRTGTGP